MRTASSSIPLSHNRKSSNSRRISQVHILSRNDENHFGLDGDIGSILFDQQPQQQIFSGQTLGKNEHFQKGDKLGMQNHQHQHQHQHFGDQSVDCLYGHFRAFLIFGKFIGLVPWQGLFQKDVNQLEFKRMSIPAIISLTIWLLLTVNAVVSFISISNAEIKTAADYASVPAAFLFYLQGIFIFVFFYRNSDKMIGVFQQWNTLPLHYTKPDMRLTFHVNLLAGLVMASAILENIAGVLRIFPITALLSKSELPKEDVGKNPLELFYEKANSEWSTVVPYNPILSLLLFFCNKFALYAQNFQDIFLAIVARAIYFKFKMVYELAEADLFGGKGDNAFEIEKWRQLCVDHSTMYKMLLKIASLLSPSIFVSYANNIYVVCLQLHLGLTPQGNTSTLALVYAVWSFMHIIVRIYMVSLTAARINDWAHQVTTLFKKCPNESYTMEVERTERFVSTNTIGLTGFGCFTITKPFILQIVSVVFTFEIVLLQATQTPFPTADNSTTHH